MSSTGMTMRSMPFDGELLLFPGLSCVYLWSGGQAGLAISYYFVREGREHVVLERAPAVANAWRNQRWDSFTLVTPNFQVRMPSGSLLGVAQNES
jgi:hypothetical protein